MKHKTSHDIAIIGAGFAGALLAWILSHRGMRVVLIERGRCGGFAIGESSTPMADLLLRQLGRHHGLPDLETLSTYASWKAHHPELTCGKKRGFSYFHHTRHQPFHESTPGQNSLLVTASPNEAMSDTHWLRSDIDAFFAKQAAGAGAGVHFESRLIEVTASDSTCDATTRLRWVDSQNDEHESNARWVINATGRSGTLPDATIKQLGFKRHDNRLQTNTQSTFAHFRGVSKGSGLFDEYPPKRPDPFDADDAAQHHVTADGWMWMLRFDEDLTSVGWTRPSGSDADWRDYPSLVAMMRGARFAEATPDWIATSRLQRYQLPVVSANFIALPTATATIDPLHSTGIAHALLGIARLADGLLSDDAVSDGWLSRYADSIEREIEQIDSLVSLCYRGLGSMKRFEALSMLYFAAAIDSEEHLAEGGNVHTPLWFSGSDDFKAVARGTSSQLDAGRSDSDLFDWLKVRLEPFHDAGLLDANAQGRYRYTGQSKVLQD